MRRVLAALVVTIAVVVLLVRYDTKPPPRLNPNSALRAQATPRALEPPPTPSPAATPAPGTKVGTGPALTTPFSAIQVKAILRGKRLVGVETVVLTGSDPHTEALNARAEPILRESALEAGSADIDVVTGATYTSRSWRDSLQAAIDAARRG